MPAYPRHKAWLDGRVLDPGAATVSLLTFETRPGRVAVERPLDRVS
jgi:hypothetical protein